MMNWRHATRDDLRAVAKDLRPEDLQEVRDMGFDTPEAALLAGLDPRGASDVGVHNGVPVCAMGVHPVSPGTGLVWMLGTPRINEIPTKFLRTSRAWVAHQRELWPVLYNYVWAHHTAAMQWLGWLGAEFTEQTTFKEQPYWLFRLSET